MCKLIPSPQCAALFISMMLSFKDQNILMSILKILHYQFGPFFFFAYSLFCLNWEIFPFPKVVCPFPCLWSAFRIDAWGFSHPASVCPARPPPQVAVV